MIISAGSSLVVTRRIPTANMPNLFGPLRLSGSVNSPDIIEDSKRGAIQRLWLLTLEIALMSGDLLALHACIRNDTYGRRLNVQSAMCKRERQYDLLWLLLPMPGSCVPGEPSSQHASPLCVRRIHYGTMDISTSTEGQRETRKNLLNEQSLVYRGLNSFREYFRPIIVTDIGLFYEIEASSNASSLDASFLILVAFGLKRGNYYTRTAFSDKY